MRATEWFSSGAALLLAAAVCAGCIKTGHRERRQIVVNVGEPSGRLQLARESATPERLEVLRANVKDRFPGLSDEDIAGLDLGWLEFRRAGRREVAVVVTYTPASDLAEAKDVADYASERVRDSLLEHVGAGPRR